MKPDYKLVAKAKYIHNTADLASELWHEVYKRYYPAKQLDTLVEELQSADAIEADIDNDVNYFLVFLGGKLIGYFAWKMENTALHLMHLYLRPEYRGKALGRVPQMFYFFNISHIFLKSGKCKCLFYQFFSLFLILS